MTTCAVAAAAPAAIAAPAVTAASVTVTPNIHYGGKATIAGRLTRSGTTQGIAGANVAVDEIRSGLRDWFRVALVKTDSQGYVRLTQPPVYNTRYRLRFAGTSSAAAVTSRAAQVNVLRNVSATSSAAEIYPGDSVQVTGSVDPVSAGTAVNLVRHDGGTTAVVATGAVDSTKHFAITYQPSKGGQSTYAVEVPAGGGRADSFSAGFGVNVLATHYLKDITPAVDDYKAQQGAQTVNGTSYPASIYGHAFGNCNYSANYHLEYDLGRAAKRFRTVAGVADNSLSSNAGRFTITVDGLQVMQQTLRLGQALPVDLDVTGALRLVLDVQYAGSGSNGYDCDSGDAVWGDARFYASS